MTEHDELLAVRCQLGEPAALDALVARWHPPLWRYARRMTGADDAAADAVQDVWMRILRGLPRLREPARLRPWIFGIARRVLMDRLRAQYAAPPESDVPVDDIPGPGEAHDFGIDPAELRAAIDALPAIERDALGLFYLDELSLQELSDVLRVPVGTVKSRLFRARRLLRARLISEGRTTP